MPANTGTSEDLAENRTFTFADALVEGVADVDTVDGEMAVGVFSFGK